MAEQNLYDLSPVLQLMLMGLAIAVGPVAWIWARSTRQPAGGLLRLLTLFTLFLTFDLVVFGAFTRLTDSGLGCPDWPGCYGSASPMGAQVHIDAAQAAMPSGPVTHPKAWIEMIHRYLATGVGVLILTATFLTIRARQVDRSQIRQQTISSWWPVATLVWVCLQGAFGALTVTMKLFPAIVTMHLLGGLVLLALLRVQSARYALIHDLQKPQAITSSNRNLLWAGFAMLWVQILLGGWVSTNYAVLACTEFPLCQNSWWPAMDFRQGFTIWRALGMGGDGGYLSFQSLTAIHYVHRLAAYAVFAVLLILSLRLRVVSALRGQANWLLGLILLQAITGLSNVVLGWPLVAAVAHTGGAAALMIVLTGLICFSCTVRIPATKPQLAVANSTA